MSGSPAAARSVGSQSWCEHDVVEHRARLDLAGPAHEGGHAPTAFPVGVLLGAERGDAGVRPAVVVRTVVRRVHDDGVVGDAQLVELGQHPADVLVVGDHDVVVVALTAALALVLLGAVGPEVHGGGVVPEEERLVRPCGILSMKRERMLRHFVVDGLHALLGERTGVLDLLPALAVGPAVQHAPGPEVLLERRDPSDSPDPRAPLRR